MLQHIIIKNYAIIEELNLRFTNGLNIITGETGAGKSIIAGALGMILGERADTGSLRDKDRKCVIEGNFASLPQPAVPAFAQANDIDIENNELILRRELAATGKSRAFINDTPVNLGQLQECGNILVDLHRQFDTLSVGEGDFQREVLDNLAGNQELLQQYQQFYKDWSIIRQHIKELSGTQEQLNKELDYNQFLFNELEEAALKENELEDADSLLQQLSHAEGLQSALNALEFELSEGDNPIIQRLKSAVQKLQLFEIYHPALPELLKRLQSTHIELQDLSADIGSIAEQTQHDPQAIEQLNERINLGYKLQKKHGVNSTAELLSIQQELEMKLVKIAGFDDELKEMMQKSGRLEEKCQQLAETLSIKRKEQVAALTQNVNTLLKQVGMPNAQLQIAILPTKELNSFGKDEVAFLFDANKSGRFQPLRKVASGGELSRLMLCIKSLVASSINTPVLVFDEIDSGISGEAAKQVGLILKELATGRQIICITHQPQIAAKGDSHFFVYKTVHAETVHTQVKKLNREERVTAIAQMMSGESPSAAALESAREMMT